MKLQVARLMAREVDRRKDWMERASTDIARRFDLIRIEDLHVEKMTRSARGTTEMPGRNVRAKAGLNRAIRSKGWGLLAERLEQKAPGRVEKINPAYTSQTCNACKRRTDGGSAWRLAVARVSEARTSTRSPHGVTVWNPDRSREDANWATRRLSMTDPAKQPCEVHRYHSPKPLVIVRHHLVPLSCGGWDTRDNYVYVCDTGHRNLHHLIGPLFNDDPIPEGGTRKERALALDAHARWVAMGKPGNPHGAYGVHAPDAPHDLPPAA